MGKGINAIIEPESIARDSVIFEFLEIPSEAKELSEQFSEFWDFTKSTNDVIRSFPKDEF